MTPARRPQAQVTVSPSEPQNPRRCVQTQGAKAVVCVEPGRGVVENVHEERANACVFGDVAGAIKEVAAVLEAFAEKRDLPSDFRAIGS